MAVRLREADNIAAMAELQQHISELEIQVTLLPLQRALTSLRLITNHTQQPVKPPETPETSWFNWWDTDAFVGQCFHQFSDALFA